MKSMLFYTWGEVEMEKVYIYGCNKKFKDNYEFLIEKYEILKILDNYYNANYVSQSGTEILVEPLNESIEDYPIVIMRNDFISAWKEIRNKKIRNRIVFQPQLKVYSNNDRVLFSEQEMVIDTIDELYYVDYERKILNISNDITILELCKSVERKKNKSLWIKKASVEPYNRDFGYSRGTVIDRYYIEKWLYENRKYIQGTVLEIAEDTYTRKFGGENVRECIMLHVEYDKSPFTKGNFETGEGISENKVDCMIITQTISCTFDINAVMHNMYKMLKKNGVCLVTTGGIAQISRYDMERWGDYWRFTDKSIRKIAEKVGFKIEKMNVYGNVKAASALLYGLAAEELTTEELDYFDSDYPVSICAVLRK